MAVITADPWEGNDVKSKIPDPQFFGTQDLTSDYYQVMIQRNRPRYCRIAWSILIFCLMVFTFFMVYMLLNDYFQYNSFNKSSVAWKSKVGLPAISICSTNSLNYTAIAEVLRDEGKEDLLDDFDAFMEKFGKYDGSTTFDDFMGDNFFNLWNWEHEDGSIVMLYGNWAEDMLVGYEYAYKFASKPQEIKNYNKTTIGTELGMCIELNDNGKLNQTIHGVSGGLTIDLDANVATYLKTTATKGFVVFIRDQDETVMYNQGGYVISPGTETFMKLNKHHVERLGKPHGTCENIASSYSKDSIHYKTVRECVQDQIINETLYNCGCIPWYWADRMYKLNKTDVLDAAVKTVTDNTEAVDEEENGDIVKKRQTKRSMGNVKSSLNRRKRSNEEERQVTVANEGGTTDPYPTMEPIYKSDYKEHVCYFVEQLACDYLIQDILREDKQYFEACPEPCQFNEWRVEITTTVYPPTEKYFNAFTKWDTWKDITFSYARDNIARLHIYYDDIKVTNVAQEKAYEIQNFIAEFGGTVDLFIGFSFFTVFQLIEIGIAMCVFKCCRRHDKGQDDAV